MRKNHQKLSHVIQDKIRETIAQSLGEYISMPVEKRQEMETKGINLSNIIYKNLYPAIYETTTRSVLIIMEEGIGNMVMLTPTIKMLKHLHPMIKITVWAKDPAAEVIKGWKLVDKVISDFDYSYYDLCFLGLWSSRTLQKYGEMINHFTKSNVQLHLTDFHEAIQNISLAEYLGGYGDLAMPHCQVAEGEDLVSIRNIIDKELKGNKYIVFGDTSLRNFGWECKKWTHYEELAKKIDKKFPEYKIVLIGDKEDAVEAKEKSWPENVNLNIIGNVNIPQLAYLLEQADIYIGNDTGPTHMAAALGTKTFAIFAPTKVSKNKPLGKDVTIINKRFPCSPCQYTERFNSCECIQLISSGEVYNKVFFPENEIEKERVLLVGDFSPGALRNEFYIKRVLEKEFKFKVIPFEYRIQLKKTNNPIQATYALLNEILHQEPKHVLICGGQDLVPEILAYVNFLSPETKLYNWYVDNRGQVEPWFYNLSSVCNKSFWSTGDPMLLSKVFSQTQRPCEFLPITPDEKSFYPLKDVEKDIDISFVGIPHTPERVNLLTFITEKLGSKYNIKFFGNGEWPAALKKFVNPGVFGPDLNRVLNRSKIVINQNIINTVPLYFSDRYFYCMATKTVGLNKRIPRINDMFEDGKHMLFFDDPNDCVDKINTLLGDAKLRTRIAAQGYKLYKKKYTLNKLLCNIFDEKPS